MTKSILTQYTSLLAEREDLKKRIARLEDKLEDVISGDYIVSDTVACGRKGRKPLRTVKISGTSYREYHRIKTRLTVYRGLLQQAQEEIDATIIEVEKYIQEVEDSYIRLVFRYRYVDGLTWTQIGHKLHCGESTVRMAVKSYFSHETA